MTKIDIISGFLGAGKTTFIKKMLEESFKDEQIVLIENEFGEVGIDGGFLKDAGIEITEMNSGCICCSLVGDFATNLHEVIHKFHPDRILIEPSGVGKLSDVMKSVIDIEAQEDVKLNALVTVVNALKASKQMKAFGEFFNNQIATPEQLEFCVKQIQSLNPKAAIITTDWSAITGAQILKVIEGQDNLEMKTLAEARHAKDEEEHEHEHHHHHHDHDEDEEHEHEHHHHDHDEDEEHEHHHHHDHDEDEHEHHHHHDHDEDDDHDHDHGDGEVCPHCGGHHSEHEHHHHHHADDVFTSWGKETPHKFERSKIEEILKKFSEDDTILRAKGMVESTDGTWIYFDMVPGEYEIREGEPDYTGRLVVIGTEIHEHELEEIFGLN
jgi:G3E family GTPase